MTVENIPRSISTKEWGQVEIKLTTPGSAIRLSTNCAMGQAILVLTLYHKETPFDAFANRKIFSCWSKKIVSV